MEATAGDWGRAGDGIGVGRGLVDAEHSMASLAAAVAAGGPHSFAVRRSAAAFLEMDAFGPGEDGWTPLPEVGVARGRHARPAVHTLTGLVGGDVVVAGGVRCTSARRTLADLGAVAPADLVERALESALRRRLVTIEALTEAPLVGRRGGRVLREVLRRRPPGALATESDLETLFVQLARRGRLPELARQIPLRGGRIRLDCGWPWCRVGVELDGAHVHGPERLGHDLRRQNCVTVDDWLLLRFTWADVVHEPARTLGVVRRGLELGMSRM